MRPQAFAAALAVAAAALAADGQTAEAGQRDAMRFRAMDRNGDGAISRDEWRGSDRSFRAHDWNGDGILSGDEVRAGGTRSVPDDEEDDYDQSRRPVLRNWTARAFQGLDHDRDGRISRAEWHYDMEAFYRADRNRDNALSRAEFLGTDGDADREDRFEYLDENGNGRLERSEWHGSQDAFEWLDRNHDGVLSRLEVIGDGGGETDLFASLDMNDDDAITWNEWHWSRRSFDRQDGNGDGRLTRAELTNAELSAANAGTVGTSGRQLTVSAAERWTDTGLDVRAGETLVIQASGTITLSHNGGDTAGPGGADREASSAPFPGQPAGALIARIGDASPVFVGNRLTVTARSSGRLYLGVNDDHLPDNRGEFAVTVTKR